MTDTQLTVLAGYPAGETTAALTEALSNAFEFCGVVADATALVEAGIDHVPDAIVLHEALGKDDLPKIARELRDRVPATRVVIVAAASTPAVVEAVRSGAFSVIEPDDRPDHLIATLKSAARGESTISAPVAAAILTEMSSWTSADPNPINRVPSLTMTEAEVLRQLANGRSAQEIAVEHDVTARLVNLHVGYAVAKLQLHLARERKLITQ